MEKSKPKFPKRICCKCGQEYYPASSTQKACRQDKVTKCVICGKEIHYKCGDFVPATCCIECRSAYSKKQFIEKYGVDNPAKLESSIAKQKQTCMKKYGRISFTGSAEYKEKVKKTSMERYGTEHYMSSEVIANKRKATNLQKYGVENPAQSEEVKKRIKESFREKYGVENISQLKEIQDKITENNIAKYGVKHPMMLKEYQDKAAHTNEKLYGRRAYTQQHIKNIENWYHFIEDSEKYIQENYVEPPSVLQLAADLGVDTSTVDVYLSKNDARGSVRCLKSRMKEAVTLLIRSKRPNIKIIGNDRTIIKPKEIDIYLPEYKFGIECNPTCTHNSSMSDPWGGEPKPSNYHYEKTNLAEEAGIQLFNVFGYEWENKREIIESMILNKLGLNGRKIYARKCEVKEVSGADAIAFLNKNHRQGACNSPIRLGLYYENELVSLMTFGKMRSGIGTGSQDLSNCYELVRFCNTLNTSVVGGASKLFKHFVREYNPPRIRSFSDRAHTCGGLYQTLGFTEVARSRQGYVWVDIFTDIAYNRVNAQKHNLKHFLQDDTIDLTKTEKQIMEEHGFVQVFDSGTITWEWSDC